MAVALAEIVGKTGRVYAVDSDPRARDVVAAAAAEHSQVIAITQAGEDLLLPELVDLAFCRFLLLHVYEPAVVLERMRRAVRPGGLLVAQEPITSAGRIDGVAMSMPEARHPDVGALLPALVGGRARRRRRLGRGAGRRRAGPGRRLPRDADRVRPRGRSCRVAAARHGRSEGPRQLAPGDARGLPVTCGLMADPRIPTCLRAARNPTWPPRERPSIWRSRSSMRPYARLAATRHRRGAGRRLRHGPRRRGRADGRGRTRLRRSRSD